MAIDKEIKKKVIDDWLNAFPQLTLYTQDKLYRIVGSIIIGIELIKLPRTNEYRPHFVIYSLCGNKIGNDVKSCLAGPILLQEYYNKKDFQYDIPYENHNAFFSDALESIRKQTPLLFEDNISLKKLISVLDEYSKTPPLSAAPNSYLQAVLQEAKLRIALSLDIREAQVILDQIKKRAWDVNNFKAFGIEVDKWLQELQKTISNREELLKQIEINKEDKKISKLKSSEIIL